MSSIEFERDSDFATERHQRYRSEGWLGGSFTEVSYFLSCLTRKNHVDSPVEVWEPAAKQFIAQEEPQAAWIGQSRYFLEFACLLLKNRYRASGLGEKFPIREEHPAERVTRFVISHPSLSIEELASNLKTTIKQLQRNSTAMLARREFERLTAGPKTDAESP